MGRKKATRKSQLRDYRSAARLDFQKQGTTTGALQRARGGALDSMKAAEDVFLSNRLKFYQARASAASEGVV